MENKKEIKREDRVKALLIIIITGLLFLVFGVIYVCQGIKFSWADSEVGILPAVLGAIMMTLAFADLEHLND